MSDRLLRVGTTLAVLSVALIAAVISYQHLYTLALTDGEPRLDSTLIPLAIDGTVITASLLMLRAARAHLKTPWLARLMLVTAVAMTVAANVAFGWRYAAWGVLMAGFPAAAFLGNAEATIMFGRTKPLTVSGPEVLPESAAETAHQFVAVTAHDNGLPLNGSSGERSRSALRNRSRSAPVSIEVAEQEFKPEITSGAVPSLRSIRSRLHVGPVRAKAIQAHFVSAGGAG